MANCTLFNCNWLEPISEQADEVHMAEQMRKARHAKLYRLITVMLFSLYYYISNCVQLLGVYELICLFELNCKHTFIAVLACCMLALKQ